MAKVTRVLIQGMESEETIDILLSMTRITSPKQIADLKRHYVNGWSLETLAENADASNFAKVMDSLNAAAEKNIRLIELQLESSPTLLRKALKSVNSPD